MVHCGEKWVNLIEKHPEICEMSEDYRRKVEKWTRTCEGIIARGFDRNVVFKKFPEGAHRELPAEDDPLWERAINYVCNCLKRGEKVTGSDLKKTLAGWRETDNCTSCSGEKRNTIVLSPSPKTDVKPKNLDVKEPPEAPPVTLAAAMKTPPSPDAAVRKEEMREAAANQPIPAWSQETCKSGTCPDGQCHTRMEEQRGLICMLWNQQVNQLSLCHVIEQMKREIMATPEFQRASAMARIDSAKPIKPAGVKVVKTREPIVIEPSPKQWEFIDQLMEHQGLDTPAEAMNELLNRAMEQEGE